LVSVALLTVVEGADVVFFVVLPLIPASVAFRVVVTFVVVVSLVVVVVSFVVVILVVVVVVGVVVVTGFASTHTSDEVFSAV
jgi:hypothetical protein